MESSTPTIMLMITRGPGDPDAKAVPLRAGSTSLVGRAPHCDVHLPDPTVSREQCRLHIDRQGRVSVCDVGRGVNPTLVSGEAVALCPGRQSPLNDLTQIKPTRVARDEVIRVSDFKLAVHVDPTGGTQVPCCRCFGLIHPHQAAEATPNGYAHKPPCPRDG